MATVKNLRISIAKGAETTKTALVIFTPTSLGKILKPELEKLYTTYANLWRNQQKELVTEAADAATVCESCAGTGLYIYESGGTGTCFRCKGKRIQSADDVKRNAVYDKHNV